MTVAKPDHFDAATARSLAKIRQQLTDAAALYRWAYEPSLSGIVRESAGKVMTGGVSDPVGGIVGDPYSKLAPGAQRRLRAALERATRHLADAENAIGAIQREIQGAFDSFDPREGFEPLRYPISVTQAELEESKAAQQRRHDRGEGVA